MDDIHYTHDIEYSDTLHIYIDWSTWHDLAVRLYDYMRLWMTSYTHTESIMGRLLI